MVAQPLRRAEALAISGSCVAPLRLGGRRGKQSTPRVWLGGTGERSMVGELERRGSKGQGKHRGSSTEESGRQRYGLLG